MISGFSNHAVFNRIKIRKQFVPTDRLNSMDRVGEFGRNGRYQVYAGSYQDYMESNFLLNEDRGAQRPNLNDLDQASVE